ncbi:MAG: DUF2800 domain-containing protein [Kiritimatiellaceae bacterium]|nr:DUF2800 domain-containing protein [Kiritimatiellaceae bacterium]
MTEKLHAKHSPSSLKNKELCPHWTNRPGSSKAADEGTMMHSAADTGHLEGLNEEQTIQVQLCLDYVQALEESIPDCKRFNELQVDVCGLTFGTADVILLGQHSAVVIDYKMGKVPVDDASVNLQGWAYALGTFDLFEVEAVKVVFVQPRCDLVTEHTFSRTADYLRMQARVATVILLAEDPHSPYCPHPENCSYCGAQARCPALAAKALAVIEQLPDRLALPAILDPSQITHPDQMALALHLAPVLTAWAESVRAHALEMVQNGQEILGYELRHRSGPRTIKELVAVWDIVHAEFSVPLQEFLTACSISVTALETAVKKSQARGKGAEAVRKMNQLLTAEGLCVSGSEVSYLAKEKTQTAHQNNQ